MRSETRSAGRAMPPYGAALLLVVASRARALAPPFCRALVARHGETTFNEAGLIQGTLESELTPRGRDQARELGRALGAINSTIARVHVSSRLRARQTLAALASEFPALAAVPPVVRPGLREIEHVPWEGRARADVMRDDGDRWAAWKADPETFRFVENGAAPLQDCWERAAGEWAALRDATRAGEVALVVAHGAFNRCLLAHALGLPMSVFRDAKERFVFANCECVELEWRAGGSNAHADRWRRRVPTPSAWSTGGEERARLEGAG